LSRVSRSSVLASAREAGFDLAGIAAAAPRHADGAEEGYRRWIDAGMHASMGYLQRGLEKRIDPERVLPGVRSVIVLAVSYGCDATDRPAPGLRISRYALGRDYHEILLPRVRRLEAALHEREPASRSRGYVDTGPVLEKVWAWRAGLGWIGKNGCLITTGFGSWVFLAVVLTTLDLEPSEPHPDRCGTCSDCLPSCPTRAIVEPRIVDARRCISYSTIEHRGAIDEAMRGACGDWLVGCDLCQEVCPWNTGAATTEDPAFAPREVWTDLSAERILAMSDEELRALRRGSAAARLGRRGLLRNAAVVAGNRRTPAALGALKAAADDPDPVVREQVAAALRRLALQDPSEVA